MAGLTTNPIHRHARAKVGNLRGNRHCSLQHPQRYDWHGRRVSLDTNEDGKQHNANRQRSDNPGTAPGQLIPTKAQPKQLRRDSSDEQQGAREIDSLPQSAKSTFGSDPLVLVLEHEIPGDEGKDREGHLQEEAPAPADVVGNGAAKGGSADGSEANDAVLHGLIHAALAKGNHVRVDNGG